MKISKLFHWLYATLMFLPLMFFIPSIIYFAFNEHATNTETTTINYKYQSNEVNSVDDLVVNNIYGFNYLDDNFLTYEFAIRIYSYESFLVDDTSLTDVGIDDYFLGETYNSASNNYLGLIVNRGTIYLLFTNEYAFTSLEIFYQNSITITNFVFSIEDGNLESIQTYFSDLGFLPQYTDYNVIESVEVNTDNTIPQQVSRAWDSIWQLPLFSWTHNSFVAAPFTYITGLFGVGSDNTLNYVFAYFVSISICWLVFDLIMYVPNLAHRWLDRSALE